MLHVIEQYRCRYGDHGWPTTHARYVLGQAYAARLDRRAVAAYRDVLDHYGWYYGRDSRTYVAGLRNLTVICARLGWRDAERDALEELVELERNVFGTDRAEYAFAVGRLRAVEAALGHHDEVRILDWAYHDAVDARRRRLLHRWRRLLHLAPGNVRSGA